MEDTVSAFKRLMTDENLKLPLAQFMRLFDNMIQTELNWGQPEDVELDKAMGENPALREANAGVLTELYETLMALLKHYGSTWSDKSLMKLAEYLYDFNHFSYAKRIRQNVESQRFTRHLTFELQVSLMQKAVSEPEPGL